jgi:hypothetical protein
MAKFHRNYSGAGIVADFRRLLTTGDVGKLTPRLYHCLTQSGGFIAHFDIHGFRQTYDGRLTELLAGEMYPLADRLRWERMAHLEDSDYRDGMTAGDVMREVSRVAYELAPMVRAREAEQRANAEVAQAHALAARHGLKVVSA